jgi:two-component system chemotaxis response regulator CheV
MAISSERTGILLTSGTNEVEFIEFNIGNTAFGINVAKVQRVIARPAVKITHGSTTPGSALMGTIYVHNQPVQLIDLRKALHLKDSDAAPVAEDRQLILVTRFNKLTISFLIDNVNKIHRTAWEEFEPIDLVDGGVVDNSYVTGTIKIKGKVIVILDLEHLILEYLPRMEEDELEAVVETQTDKLAERAKMHIVYAEDSRIIRKMMVNTLHEHGYINVKSFEHGGLAYDYLMELREAAEAEGVTLADKVNCVITDIEMPRMDGLTLCKKLKDAAIEKEIPSVVVYSSLVNQEMAQKCKSVGADAQISKPHGHEIIDVIDKLCFERLNA